MQKFTAVVLLTVVASMICSCGSKSREDLIVGSWSFEKDNKDKMIIFKSDKNCYSVSTADGKTDTLSTYQYKLTDGDKTLITVDPTSISKRNDTVQIVELTALVFKIKTPAGDTISLKKN
jgi:hypothetical protein